MTTTLKIRYDFEEIYITGNKLLNWVTKKYDGTLYQFPFISEKGPVKGLGSIHLNGINQYIQIDGDVSNSNGISYSFWFFHQNPTNTTYSLYQSQRKDGSDAIKINILQSILECTVGSFTLKYNINNNKWNHIVWTLNNPTGWSVYINGNIITPLTNGSASTHYPRSVFRIDQTIGKYVKGLLSDFRIYNGILSQSDVTKLYTDDYSNHLILNTQLNTQSNNLYSPIYCNMVSNNNKNFYQCNNCNFGDLNILKQSTQHGEQLCLNNCYSDARCTSYQYDTKATENNCTEYTSFPNEIYKGPEGVNSGYSLNFSYDYNQLSNSQKNHIQKYCGSQYINNTQIHTTQPIEHFSTAPSIHDINIQECLETDATNITADAECIWDIYNKNNLNPNQQSIFNYIQNPSISVKSTTDPIIDEYEEKYNTLINTQASNINKNPNSNSNADMVYANTVQTLGNQLSVDYDKSIIHNPFSTNYIQQINSTNQLIESFENQTKQTQQYIIYICILIILFIMLYIFF